ncbi:UDP-N-acetylmuramoyl-tripeptide--D-alanyl-D-alanine ligase [Streptomyces sp. NPDC053474]|uniref:UDP-N-acetylmuramoyl-tripeptide--D-alanyl-D- alanine ligase n=1 Tax=Streptomyces sp. NPDC053474 TaxID=3365704 RepID=UPI0037D484FE
MISLDLNAVAAVVGGRLHRADGSRQVHGTVEFDSRKVGPGSLFVALPGQRSDGLQFAEQAVARGAVAVLTACEVTAPAVVVPSLGSYVPSDVLALAGDSDGVGAAVLAALAKLASHVLRQVPGCAVVGVTGSVGKTSTKNLIGHLLARLGPTVTSPRSFNNELGQPWTVLRIEEDTRHLVLELGTRGIGHLATLCATAPPRVGVVLNVGDAHIGSFGSQDAIAAAKGELVEALPHASAGGVAVLNADDPRVAAMANRTSARVVLTGRHAGAHLRATGIELDSQARPRFTMRLDLPGIRGSARVALPTHGEHQIDNALAAAAVALEFGATIDEVIAGLENDRSAPPHRMAVHRTPEGVTVIDDARNVSSGSVRAALRTLAAIANTGDTRKWALLGTAHGPGFSGDARHDSWGRLAAQSADRIVVIGEDARQIHEAAVRSASKDTRTELVPDVEAAMALLRDELRAGDVVLLKGSRKAALWRIADALLPADTPSTGWDSDFDVVTPGGSPGSR